jgi:hypothetical protein
VLLIVAALVSAAFIAAWVGFAWLVMLATLYVVRLIPMTGWRSSRRKS